jgi:hypothetical protein
MPRAQGGRTSPLSSLSPVMRAQPSCSPMAAAMPHTLASICERTKCTRFFSSLRAAASAAGRTLRPRAGGGDTTAGSSRAAPNAF